MKTHYRFLLGLILTLTINTAYAQWQTTGTNVTQITQTNNVIVGPIPTTPTKLHINSSATTATTVTIENTNTGNAHGAYLTFKNGGSTYTMGTNSYPSTGSGLFHIGNSFHMGTGGQITLSNGYSPQYTGPFAIAPFVSRGLSAFDSIYTQKIGLGMYAPNNYNFGASGNSYFQNKVVIGTTSTTLPLGTHKLYVGGSMICEEIFVKLQANWPDFVFAPTYSLMPLNQVKSYIAENSHLPGVPAACEIAETGVATGEMLTIQMKKIEELTLYLIQMEERIKALETQNKALISK